ncbi:hypothetical protein D0907_20015 (plasmid) [Pseudoalteromonas lipolytica]|uniref:Uncharacterized protein n=1 Tax=Pseudoalteromonas lipolytica TaxID=570156 RepID=A0AAD0S3V1_9GAMM|nr:hypothetical protein D0907_20015 [Pseudoalteromonas donghaensis]
MTSLFHIANKINEMLTEYELGNLQELRKKFILYHEFPQSMYLTKGGKKGLGCSFRRSSRASI